jgi:hypothetical protein
MSALSQERNTPQYGVEVLPQLTNYPVKAGALLFQGGIAVLNGGWADKGQVATGLVALGRIEKTIDNSTGANGTQNVPVRQGVFKFGNSAAADAIALVNVGSDCFLVDDQTVALTNGGGTRSRAGKIINVEPDGVWVLLGVGL